MGERSSSGAVRRWRIDLSPLRSSRDFRFLFASGLITYLGSMATYVALPFQVADLTDSYLAVGLLGAVEVVPLIIFGLYGGTLADRLDRQRMALFTEIGMFFIALTLVANALLDQPRLWVIYAVAGLFAVLDGLQRPSLEAMVPRIVAHEQLAAAGALNSLRWNVGSIAGPAIGGIIVAVEGVHAAYAFDALTFVVSVAMLARIKPLPPQSAAAEKAVRAIRQGLAYAWSRKDLLGTYAVDSAAMVFAFPYALFPFMAKEFDAPWAVGLLYAAASVGALVATLTSGWTSRVHRHGRMVVLAAGVWGASVALTGLAPSIWWVLGLLVIAGAADMVSGLFRMLIWNQTIPDELRGRMAGIEMLSYSLGPLGGQLRSTGFAALGGLRFSLLSGGLLCVAAAVVCAATLPALWRFDARTDPNAVRERAWREAQSGLGESSPGG